MNDNEMKDVSLQFKAAGPLCFTEADHARMRAIGLRAHNVYSANHDDPPTLTLDVTRKSQTS